MTDLRISIAYFTLNQCATKFAQHTHSFHKDRAKTDSARAKEKARLVAGLGRTSLAQARQLSRSREILGGDKAPTSLVRSRDRRPQSNLYSR